MKKVVFLWAVLAALGWPTNSLATGAPIINLHFTETPVTRGLVNGAGKARMGDMILDGSLLDENVNISAITLKLVGSINRNSLVNLKLLNTTAGNKIGQTSFFTGSNSITFYPTNFTLHPDETIALTLYADLLATANGGDTILFVVESVTAVGVHSALASLLNISFQSNQIITVIESGGLIVTPEKSGYTNTYPPAFDPYAEYSAGSYKLRAVKESVIVTDIMIAAVDPANTDTASANWDYSIQYVKVLINGAQVGSLLSPPNAGIALLSVSSGTIVIPAGTEVSLEFKVGVSDSNFDSVSDVFRLGLACYPYTTLGACWGLGGGYDITAYGAISGSAIDRATITNNHGQNFGGSLVEVK